jgi:glycosyltransferase involved in cell wall biosynthesis
MTNFTTEPLVSVVIPTYNRAHLIGETIQSVIDQTYAKWEVIIVDDGSEDDTASVVARFAHEKIRYKRIAHTGRLGSVKSHGIEVATGDYIAFLDSDDLWRFDKLAVLISLSRQYPEASFIFSNVDQFGEGAVRPPDCENILSGDFFHAMVFEKKFNIYPSSFVFRKEALRAMGPMKEHLVINSEVDFFYRAAHRFKGVFTNERLASIRKHNQNTSSAMGFLTYTELIEIYTAFREERLITRKQYNGLAGVLYYTMGLDYYRKGRPKSAFATFLKSSLLQPGNWRGWARLLQVSPLALRSDE